jgi:hypothetical protein
MPDAYKTISLTPLTGIFDARSSVDAEPSGAFVWKQDFEISPDGKLRQAHGFSKPYNINPLVQNIGGVPCPYANWDWHNQGVAVASREPPTMLFASTTNDGVRKLVLGTKTRLMLMDESAGSWSQLNPSALGNDGTTNLTQTRFHAAELQNKVVFTNGLDDVQYYDLIAATFGPIPGLATASETGGTVTQAKVVIQWQGVVFLMNVVEDGVRVSSRIRWSDLNDVLNWGAGLSSISDYQDLDYGEEILGAVPLGGALIVLTNQSLWRCTFSIDSGSPGDPLAVPPVLAIAPSAVLNCVKFYTDPKNQSRCLAYPNSLVSTGSEIYYAGSDGIYEYDVYKLMPDIIEWIHRADVLVFDDPAISVTAIDKTCCNSPVAEYRSDTKEIHFSWPSPDLVQVGSDSCDAIQPIQGSGINRHTLVINTGFTTCDYREYGSTAMVNFKSDVGSEASCNQSILFLGANGTDFCLKQFGVGYAWEIYDPTIDSYAMTGYSPLLRGVFPFGTFDKDKFLKSFRIDCIPDGDTGTVFRLRIGTSYKAVNPNSNDASCGILWTQFSDKAIKCPDQATLTAYATTKTRPTDDFKWSFLLRGRLLYYEITIAMPDGAAANSGGVSLSRFDVQALQV